MISEEQSPIKFSEHRKRIHGVDQTVQYPDSNGLHLRTFQSTTFVSDVPDRPRILESAKGTSNGTQTMITVSVEPIEGVIPDLDSTSPYEVTTQFFNWTNSAIKVTDKNNISFTLPKPKTFMINQVEHLVVRRTHRFHNADIARSVLLNHQVNHRYLSVSNEELKTILMMIRDYDKEGAYKNFLAYTEIKIDRLIPIELFHHHASIFVADVDTLFCLDGVDIGTPHPTSQDAMLRGEILEQVGDRRITGALYEIIDNDNQYGSRYICLGKNVVQIPTNRDPGKPNGIYFTEINNINSKQLQITMNHMELEKAETLGIYSTKEEASTKGHVAESHKLLLAEKERELREMDMTNRLVQQERDAALADLAHERRMKETRLDIDKTNLSYTKERLTSESNLIEIVAKLDAKLETDRLEREQMRRKDEYEQRSQMRKDSSEIFKWAPSIITGIIGISTALAIQRNKSKE